MKLSEIRTKFLKFFEEKGHAVVKSSPLVPANDPTLLFTNAGMVQFKDLFLGNESRKYNKAVTVQRCLRAGGKHNDLENVGYTARHHTFFEMLGNFSFGDYFKEEAIRFAWSFLTEVLKLPKEKLWVTIYKDDDEAADIWVNKIGVDPNRLSRCGEEDNYWSMGDTGPCGPCTEIFYDHGPQIPGGPPGSPDGELDRYIEIWNIVFMQYDKDAQGDITPLPKPSIDTGMGIERLAAVVQGVHNNYEIDLFSNLIKAAADICQVQDLGNQSLKVLADHIRSCSFLIVDGVVPSNEGRGYVLRRIIRRAIRHGNKLGVNEPFFYKLVEHLCKEMAVAYPELQKTKETIEIVLQQEEQQFARTLEQGLKILKTSLAELSDKVISGELAFKLYDTYGFPIDLTMDIARENNYRLDTKGFEQELNKQRDRSKQHSGFKVADNNALANIKNILSGTSTDFTGYNTLEQDVLIANLLNNSSQQVEQLNEGDTGYIVTQSTPFYAEGGGQVGDQGTIKHNDFTVKVLTTIKVDKAHLHKVVVEQGNVTKGTHALATVDLLKRKATASNHSATHLLHAALRKHLGEQVIQKGSYVGPDYLRFDFAFFRQVTPQELETIETEVNNEIIKNTLTDVKLMDIDQAMASGAMALFGEKYDSKVRVLNFGHGYSVELCGGTHVHATGDIGLFVITQETSVAAGIRRIEALTEKAAFEYLKAKEEQIKILSKSLKVAPSDLISKINQLQKDNAKLEKALEDVKNSKLQQQGKSISSLAEDINGIKVVVAKLDGFDAKQLRTTLDSLKSELHQAVILLAAVNDPKVSLIAGVTNNVKDKINAVELVNYVAGQLGGKGGGRPDMAQAGCKNTNDLEKVIESAKPWIHKSINE